MKKGIFKQHKKSKVKFYCKLFSNENCFMRVLIFLKKRDKERLEGFDTSFQ